MTTNKDKTQLKMAENKQLSDIFEAISRLTEAVMKGVNEKPPPPPSLQYWRGEKERSGERGGAGGAGGGGGDIEMRLSMLERTVKEQKAIIEKQASDIVDLKKAIEERNNDFPRLPERSSALQARARMDIEKENEEEIKMRKRRKVIDQSERTIYLKPITNLMLEAEEDNILEESKEEREKMNEEGKLMVREAALRNLVLNFLKNHLKVSSENLTKLDIDRIFTPDNFKKDSFDKLYVELPNVEIVSWLMGHVRNLEGGGGEEGVEIGNYTPAECYERHSSFEEEAYHLRKEAREKGDRVKTRVVGRVDIADFVLKIKQNPSDRWRVVKIDESKLKDFDFSIDKRQGRGGGGEGGGPPRRGGGGEGPPRRTKADALRKETSRPRSESRKRQRISSPQRPSSPSPMITGASKSGSEEVSASNETGRLDLLFKNDKIKVSKT